MDGLAVGAMAFVVTKDRDQPEAAQQTNVGHGRRQANPSRRGRRFAKAPTSTEATYPSSSSTATRREAHTDPTPAARPPDQATRTSTPKTPATEIWAGSSTQPPANNDDRAVNLSATTTCAANAYRPSAKAGPYGDRSEGNAISNEPTTGSTETTSTAFVQESFY